jgi:hypothetical protein
LGDGEAKTIEKTNIALHKNEHFQKIKASFPTPGNLFEKSTVFV